MPGKPRTIDEYIASVSKDKRPALEALRKTIRAAAPRAEECISYQLAAFRLEGKVLVAFGAAAKHCSLYLMSDATVEAHKEALAGYSTSKGTVRFSPEKPLPAALVRKLVKARIAENGGKAAAGGARKGSGSAAERPPRRGKKGAASLDGRLDPAVSEFIRKLDHPLKSELEALRQIILGVDPAIGEGIKWNAPSFRTTEHFATFNLRERGRLRLILHLGAKVKDGTKGNLSVQDEEGILEWLAPDRCMVTFESAGKVRAKRGALEGVIRQWMRHI